MKANDPKDFAEMKQPFPAVGKVGTLHVFDIGGNKIQ
jgi:mRNA interferase HigB